MTTAVRLQEINPYIRYVNDYQPQISYTEVPRILYDYELMYVREGSVKLHFDGNTYVLKKDDLFLLSPHKKNYITVAKEMKFRTHCIHFDFIQLPEKYNFTAQEAYIDCTLSVSKRFPTIAHRTNFCPNDFLDVRYLPAQSSSDVLAELFNRAYFLYLRNDSVSALELKGVLLEILSAALRRKNPEISTPVHPQIQQAIMWINSNYATPIKVCELAKQFGFSPKYFGTLFLHTTGYSVNQYVIIVISSSR